MKTKISKNIGYWTSVVVVGITLGLALQFAKAWTEPTLPPPGGNVGAPLNTSGIGQFKEGGLMIHTAPVDAEHPNGLIVQNGNVGIGTTTNPARKLEVNGILRLPDNNQIEWGGPKNYIYGNNASNLLSFTTNGVERMKIDSNGNIGIGTPDIQSVLHAYATTADGSEAGRTNPLNILTLESRNISNKEYDGFGQAIAFRGVTYNNGTRRVLSRIVSAISDDSINTTRGTSLKFETSDNATNTNAPTEKVRIDYNGNVGIGTTEPKHGLTIKGRNMDVNGFKVDSTLGLYLDGSSTQSAGINFALNKNNLDKGGDAAIGIANYYTGFGSDVQAGDLGIESNQDIHLATSGSGMPKAPTRMIIKNNGNVGIGIIGPAYKLDVNGNARINGTVYPASDERLKTNIQEIPNALDKILNLRGVSFNWKKDNSPSDGVIAQEVEKVFPELVSTDDKGMKSVNYDGLIAPLIESVKQQQNQIDQQQKEIDELKAAIESLKK
jgi:trimeric autotransporter adhesin